MSRYRKKWDAQGRVIYEEREGVVLIDRRFAGNDAHMVMGDIAPYKSMIDGSTINSRSRHREHLRAHRCIEIGNETKYLQPKPYAPPAGLKETLIRVVNEKTRR